MSTEATVNEMLITLTTKFGGVVEMVVSEYTHWFIVASLSWITFGAFMIYCAFRFMTNEVINSDWGPFFRGATIFLGAVVIASNVPDLFSPKAAAMHQVIKDVSSVKK